MTASTGQRSSRACVRCRQRKQRCELSGTGADGRPPCRRCQRERHRCVLAGSRRGGDLAHRRASPSTSSIQDPTGFAGAHSRNLWTRFSDAACTPADLGPDQVDTGGSSDRFQPRHRVDEGIQNPLEALEVLVRTATESSPNVVQNDVAQQTTQRAGQGLHTAATQAFESTKALSEFEPVASGDVDAHSIAPLVKLYADNYHPFMPIVPPQILLTERLAETAAKEPFLLTAILTVATKDSEDFEALHTRLWKHMRQWILRVSLGDPSVRDVGSVEGLLLLAEWVQSANVHRLPGTRTHISSPPSFDKEDCAAWSLIGLAVRQSYLLRLDKYSFRDVEPSDATADRDRCRLAWVWVYLSDRQISIRMGQAFWCRGPGLAARFTASDYVSLQPVSANDENFAHVLQAQVELTTVFGNIHDILYASKSRTAGLMLAGDYTKYLDDGAKALAAWQETWKDIRTSTKLRVVLCMLHDYLSLYIHAFALQAVVYRASDSSEPPNLPQGSVSRTLFPHGVMASPDGQHIHIALTAAKSLLSTAVHGPEPETELRFLPVRFYLYEVHAVVFLFKAFSYGAVPQREHDETSMLVQDFIEKLRHAASSHSHIANRFAVLLSHLLTGASVRGQRPSVQDVDAEETASAGTPGHRVGLSMQGQQFSLDTGHVATQQSDARNLTGLETNDALAPSPDCGTENDLFFLDGSLDFLPFPGPCLDGLSSA